MLMILSLLRCFPKKFIIIFFSLFLLNNLVSAQTGTWDFNTPSNYTYSSPVSFTLSGSIASLNQTTLAHTGVITNATNLNGAYDVVVDGNYAYVTDYLGNRVAILNVTNPAAPTLVTTINDNGGTLRLQGASGIVKDGNYLYVTSYLSNALQIINVTNPAVPTAAGQVFNTTTMGGARGITKVGNYVYVATFNYDALQVIDVINPAAPTIVGTYRQTTRMNGASEVKVYGNYVFVSCYNRDALSVIDISTPTTPTYVTQLRDSTNLNGSRDLVITSNGNYAYVSAYLNNSVRVIDISNPTSLVAITNISGGSYSINGPRDLDINGNKLFIAGYTSNAINVADISDPINPVYVTKILHNAANPLLQGADGIFIIGDLIYIASYTSDAMEVLRFMYDTTSPYIQSVTPYNYGVSNSLMSFQETLGTGNQGSIKYQISKNGGTTWYYFNGSTWVTTTGGVVNSSTASQINSNLASFNALPGGTGQFSFKAFFTSNGIQKVELDTINITASDPTSPGGVSSNMAIWLKSNAGTSTITDGASLTTWNDQSGNGYNAGGGVSPVYRYNTSTNLNFYPLVDFNGSQYLENLNNGGNSISYYMVIVPTSQIDGTISGEVPFGWDCNSGILSSGTCGLPFAGGVLGAFTIAINDEVVTHALGSSTGWRSAQIGAYSYGAGNPMLLGFNENSLANGTDIFEKGIKVDNFTANTYQTLGAADYRLGMSMDGANPFPYIGKIAEVINYTSRTSDSDRQKIESYLAFKYGITLNNGTQNYIASDGTTIIWNSSTAGSYTNNIFGVGRDFLSGLGQVQSKSSNSDSIITLTAIGEGTNLSPSFVDITDKEFFIISNDNGGNTWIQTGAPTNYDILSRKWKVQEVGDIGNISLDFDVGNTNFDVPTLMSGSTYYFVYDTNTNGSLSDETPISMINTSGNVWQVSGINPSNGQIFTLATQASSNHIPTDITLSNNSINENVSSGSTIGIFTATDVDIGDSHTYALVTGVGDADNSKFTISGNTLIIIESPDYEAQNIYTVRVQTDDGNGGQYQKQFYIYINNLLETINTIIDFETPGKYSVTSGIWTRTTTNPYEGLYSIESDNLGNPNTQSCFEVNNTFSQTGIVEFYYNVSSQLNGDYLRFYIDNVEQQAWSGTVPWTLYSKNDVLSGTHSYKWCYIKDGATNTGSDKAWIDYITFADTNPPSDVTPPTILSINYASGTLLPGGNHNLIINYTDAESGINTSSDIIALYKWNGSSWGADISSTGLNLAGKTVTPTHATYPTNNLSYGKYMYDFQISDNVLNSSSTGSVFYVDEPEIIVSTGSFDIGILTGTGLNFSSNEIIVTIKTVGAGFQVEMSKDTDFATSGGSIIIDWDGNSGIGYDENPYTLVNKSINSNSVIGTGAQNISPDGVKNTYTFRVKIGDLITPEQAAGIYNMSLSFRVTFNY